VGLEPFDGNPEFPVDTTNELEHWMLKKAGMVVLGATAGMLSLAPLANAGEAPSHGDHGQHGHHSDHRDHGGRGDCDKLAYSEGDRLVSLDNVASNLDASHINVLAADNSRDHGCDGGDKAAVSQGNRLISADNLLANADLSHVNVLAADNSDTR
jgi:hypothetical protein